MRVKLIAVVVASLFAQSAFADDDISCGAGSAEARRSRHEHRRRQPQRRVRHPRRFGANPLTPFTGPADDAKAQEYQDIDSGADRRHRRPRRQPHATTCACFGEELRPRRPVHQHRRRRLRRVEGVALQQQHSAQPARSTRSRRCRHRRRPAADRARPAPIRRRRTRRPGTRSTTAPSATPGGGNVEVSSKIAVVHPRRLQRGQDDRHQARQRPARHGLGQRPDRVRHAGRLQDEEHDHRGRLQRASSTDVKLAFLDSKFSDGNDTMQWTNFYMRSGLDTSLLPPDNELKKWSFNGYVRAAAAGTRRSLARVTQSKLTNSVGLSTASSRLERSLKPTRAPPGSATSPTRRRLPRSRRRASSTFDGDIKTTTANVAWNATPDGAARHARLLQLLRQVRTTRRPSRTRQAAARARDCATAAGSNSATAFCIGALAAPAKLSSYTKNAAGFDRIVIGSTAPKAARRVRLASSVDRDLEPAPSTDDYRVLDRVPQHQAGTNLERPAQVPVPAAALGPRSHGHQQRHGQPDAGPVLLHGLRRHQLRPEHGQARTSTGRRCRCWSSASARRGATPTTRTTTTAAPTTSSQQLRR